MNYRFLLILSGLLMIFSCNDDNNSSPEKFTGYTMTDQVGAYFGTIDSTDWTQDASWNNTEKALFSDYSTYVDAYTMNPGALVYPAYPNPSESGIFTISSTKPSSMMMKIRILDYNWKTVISLDTVTNPSLYFDLTSAPVNSDSLFRVYYMLIRNDSCFLKGHGDLSMKRGI